jgi:hypothetical protein
MSSSINVEEATLEELRDEAALITAALGRDTLTDAERESLEMGLQAVEDQATALGVDLPAATAYRLRQAIRALSADLLALAVQLKEVLNIEGSQGDVGADFPPSSFRPEAEWEVEQLGWSSNALFEAIDLAAKGEAGGPQSAEHFRAAGLRVTAVMYETQAVAIHLAYLHVGAVGASFFGNPFVDAKVAGYVAMPREDLGPLLQELRSLDATRVESAVLQLQGLSHSWDFAFSVFVDDLERETKKWHRVRQVVGIVSLALMARGLMARPGAPPPMTGGPGFAGATAGGGGVAVARGAVGSLEWLETLRRLGALGAISSTAALGKIGGGMPSVAKPTLTAASSVGQTGGGQGGAGGAGGTTQGWADLEKAAEGAAATRPTGSFASKTARSGSREVTIVEGQVRPPVADVKAVTKARGSKATLPQEHATHAVGAQLGENLPQSITSGPAGTLNLSALKSVENATRSTYEVAKTAGKAVETRTVLDIEYRLVRGEQIPVLVRVRRQAWLESGGSTGGAAQRFHFIEFEATIDPVSRAVNIVKNSVLRPAVATP